MKKLLLVAALGVAGSMSASDVNSSQTENVKEEKMKFYYHPITITSSCGYTEVIEVSAQDDPQCWMVDAQQMEDDCASPFTNPILAGYFP